jgi:MarR family transcriptional regulator, temperature-dependent positive regulator of motility
MSEVPSVHRVPAHLARRFHQICLGALAQITGPQDLSPLQFGILASIQDEPGMDQRRLAERMGIDTVSAHHHIEFLEDRGLVTRAIDPQDRRSRVLKLTKRGVQLRAQLRPGIVDAHDRVLSSLSQHERETFLRLLTRIVESNEMFARPGNGRRPPRRIMELMR